MKNLSVTRHRRFYLERRTDVTGVSGTGLVAEGVVFSDGWAVTHWLGEHSSTVVWHRPGVDSPEHVHGHDGLTRIVWVDGDDPHGGPFEGPAGDVKGVS